MRRRKGRDSVLDLGNSKKMFVDIVMFVNKRRSFLLRKLKTEVETA